jgi:hypothetical protein
MYMPLFSPRWRPIARSIDGDGQSDRGRARHHRPMTAKRALGARKARWWFVRCKLSVKIAVTSVAVAIAIIVVCLVHLSVDTGHLEARTLEPAQFCSESCTVVNSVSSPFIAQQVCSPIAKNLSRRHNGTECTFDYAPDSLGLDPLKPFPLMQLRPIVCSQKPVSFDILIGLAEGRGLNISMLARNISCDAAGEATGQLPQCMLSVVLVARGADSEIYRISSYETIECPAAGAWEFQKIKYPLDFDGVHVVRVCNLTKAFQFSGTPEVILNKSTALFERWLDINNPLTLQCPNGLKDLPLPRNSAVHSHRQHDLCAEPHS